MGIAVLAFMLAAGQIDPSATGVTRVAFRPSLTDTAITQFDEPHVLYIARGVKQRGELLLFLPGTNGSPGRENLFCETAAENGYQVLSLMYPDTTPASVVGRSTDRSAFESFRLEVIEGKNLSTYVQVDRTNSIESRLIKALQFLQSKRPREKWGQYVTESGELNWEKIAVSGLSQGAGHAGLIATKHRVARAILFGGPKDFDRASNSPAAWYTDRPETPQRDIFTFNHQQDRQGCTYPEQLLNCKAIGLDALAPPADVDSIAPPFGNSHILTTNYPGTPVPSVQAHTSVVADGSTPKRSDGSPLFKPVWLYMLTSGEPTERTQPRPGH
ncbi:MAG TPA: hypothetical protein VKT78_02780 [Fimbriimonadaceae bacterium]|nr:hypothetical protein [Fimbriimonadaceae bacterium]